MSIERRLAQLQKAVQSRAEPLTIFEVEDGTVFRTELDNLFYLHRHGARTPDGRRIVGWKRPEGRHDPLSQSLLEVIDEAIERGGFPWSEI